MAELPSADQFKAPTVTEAQFKEAQAKLIDYVAEIGNKTVAIQYGFQSFDDFEADKTKIPAGSSVVVAGELYVWDGGVLIKSAYDPVTLAKNNMSNTLHDIMNYRNLDFYSSILIEDVVIKAPGGEIVEAHEWRTSDYIQIYSGEEITLKAYANYTENANIAFYDENKQFLSAKSNHPFNEVSTVKYTAAQDGYIRVGTRIASSHEFYLNILSDVHVLTDKDIDQNVASVDFVNASTFNDSGIYDHSLKKTTNSDTVINYWIDNFGVATSSLIRRYRKVHLKAGETALFRAFSVAHSVSIGMLNGAIFVPDDEFSSPTVVSPAPTTFSANYWYEGEYTAQESGNFYINISVNSAQADSIDTSLIYLNYGIEGVDFTRTNNVVFEKNASDISKISPLYLRDKNVLNSLGSFIRLSESDYILDEYNVLFLNGSKQLTIYGSSKQSSIYIPVRLGDKVRYTGYFPANSNAQLDHIIQCDFDKKPVESLYTQPAASIVQTITVQATQTGFIAIRRVDNIESTFYSSTVELLGYEKFDIESQDQAIDLMFSMEELDEKLSMDHGYNSQTYSQNNYIEIDNYKYFVGVDEKRNPFILQQKPRSKEWSYFDLSTIAGNPFASPNAQDSHNNFVVVVTKDGRIIITGNHHAHACRAVISQDSHDIDTWSQIKYTDALVTYPRLVRNGSNTLAFWREGGSGNGTYWMSLFNDETLAFNEKILLIEKATSVSTSNPYEQMIAIDASGKIHLSWGYRTTAASAVANFGMFYAKSSDNGVTWTNANETQTYALPLTDANSERIYTVELNQGYVNQNGGCYDLNNRYHTVFWHSDPVTGNSRIIHVWFDGTIWKNEIVYDLGRSYPPTSNMLPGFFTRPHIICSQAGRLFVVFKDSYKDANKIFAIDVTDSNDHILLNLIDFSTRQTELAINIDIPFQTNSLKMVLAKGGGNLTNAIWQNQKAYLVTIPLPVQYSV